MAKNRRTTVPEEMSPEALAALPLEKQMNYFKMWYENVKEEMENVKEEMKNIEEDRDGLREDIALLTSGKLIKLLSAVGMILN